MTKWKQMFWLPENKCTVRSGVEPVLKVNIIDMFGAFFLLAIGKGKCGKLIILGGFS